MTEKQPPMTDKQKQQLKDAVLQGISDDAGACSRESGLLALCRRNDCAPTVDEMVAQFRATLEAWLQ